tara:strand:- start:27907 stop:29166 length:1260 start_codon:yes stop_codon:yes gene_type:complete
MYQYIFYLALLLLPSASVISGILFLIALFASFYSKNSKIDSKWDKLLFLSSLFIVISCIFHTFSGIYLGKNFIYSLSWIGLFNWIPLFLCFFGFQQYLDSAKKREISIYCIIASSIPVIVTCFGQYWLNWNGGPYKAMGGLVIWYLRPMDVNDGISGLFSNPNYTAAWLISTLPLCLAIFQQKVNNIKKLMLAFNVVIFSISIVITNSRSAWICSLVSLILMYGRKSLNFIIPLISTFSILIYFCISSISFELQQFAKSIIPQNIWYEFVPNSIPKTMTRLNIWRNAFSLIKEKPIFGWGPESFSKIYESNSGTYVAHAHNLFLDLSLNYGLIVGLLTFAFISYLLIKAFLTNNNLQNSKFNVPKTNQFDKAWCVSCLILTISQLVDVQYYDGRISIIFWIFMAGVKAQIKNKVLEISN